MNLPPVIRQRYFDANGNPLAGGKLYTYQAGTTTPQATYTDSGGLTANSNPIVLDANGEAAVWLDPILSYKFVLKNSSDVTQWTVDNVIGLLTNASVATASIQDSAVSTVKIADDAVTSAKLRDSLVTDSDRAVTTNHIRDSAVTTAKIANEAVTGAKLAPAIVDSATIEISSNVVRVKDSGITRAKLAARTYTTDGSSPGVGGIAIAASSGAFSTGSGAEAQITNQSVSITLTGRPVEVRLISNNSNDGSFVGFITTSTATGEFLVMFRRSGTEIARMTVNSSGSSSTNTLPPSAFAAIDYSGVSGAVTYTAHVFTNSGVALNANYVRLMVRELY